LGSRPKDINNMGVSTGPVNRRAAVAKAQAIASISSSFK
jgi:hypothetical protein